METKSAIDELMLKLEKWDLLKDLSEGDKKSIRLDLHNIASTAVMESHKKIKDILPDFYNQLRKD